jgi:hypothetical protein
MLPYKGGAMALSKELQTGKSGEHLVCFDLIQQGYNAFLADQGLPYDVIVDTGKQMLRIQVKTVSKKNAGNGYAFSLRSGKKSNRLISIESIDYMAFVFLDKRIVQYIPSPFIAVKDGFFKQSVVFYETTKDSKGNQRKYILGGFNSLQ